MDTVSDVRSRQALDRLMDKVTDDRAPLIVKRPGKRAVVMMDLEDYRGREETIYLMRSPANARRLLRSMQAADRGDSLKRRSLSRRARLRGARSGEDWLHG